MMARVELVHPFALAFAFVFAYVFALDSEDMAGTEEPPQAPGTNVRPIKSRTSVISRPTVRPARKRVRSARLYAWPRE